jgi:curved DNA-binding protein
MPVEFQDYYATLEVARDATEQDIKKAFRTLARKYHPDVAKDKKNAEEKFKQINEAYEVLGDPEKRKKYDELGAHWKDGNFQPPPEWQGEQGAEAGGNGAQKREYHFGGTGFSDFFEHAFGGGRSRGFAEAFGGGRGAPQAEEEFSMRGSDIEGDILVTLEEVLNGATRTISLQHENPATGQMETDTIKVRIPPGVHEGQAIRVAGKGQAGMGQGEAGDLYLRVRFAGHPEFRARGADLYCDLELAPWEGVLGTSVTMPVLGGGQVKLKVPADSNNGRQFRIRGQGLPKGRGGERGDLYAVVSIQLPSNVSGEERELWEKLSQASEFNPRAST